MTPVHFSVIDNVIKEYLQNDINKTNNESVSGKIPNIGRYFKLRLIQMYSKMIQNVIEKLCKNFCKKVKVRLVFTSYKLC